MAALGLVSNIVAQENSMAGGNLTACEGFLVDDGLSASSYSNNANQTVTICAVAPETITNLYWNVFNLGAGDFIEIYDGPNSSAPLIGTYEGTELQAYDITSTNASGCLTVHFVSNNTGTGNFTAEISCGPPCERPVAVIETVEGPSPLLGCPGDAVTFNASASQFAAGTSIQSFTWVFDDGTTNSTDWPSVTHTYGTPGGYEVELFITDNNDCNSANLPDYVVFISTYPDFSLLSPEFELCVGGSDTLGVNWYFPSIPFEADSVNEWITQPWVDLPDADLGGALFIPDDQTECFSDELTFSNFNNDATITNVSDLDFFYINFEHSFMGDLSITFICPNGQSIAVHQQGGGGTWLGEPIDDDGDLDPGVGYDYWWSPAATLGTWEDEGLASGGTLPSGTYQSTQSWDALLGCPLNGTWTVEVCDSWASDNGYIFDWGMAFNPTYYGELLQFTPIYGADCDSTYWEGPGIVNTSDNCDFIEVELDETGDYEYTYTAINNFGCTFDTLIEVHVFIAEPVSAGPDLVYSCDDVQLLGSVDADPTDYIWLWSPATGLSSVNVPQPYVQDISFQQLYTLTGYPIGYPGCSSTDQALVTIDPSLPNPGEDTQIAICPAYPALNMFDVLQGDPEAGGSWYNAGGNPVDPTFDPATDPGGTYYYTIEIDGCSLSVELAIDVQYPEVEVSNDTTICINGSADLFAWSDSDFDNSYQYTWSTGATGNSLAVTPTTATEYWVYATDAGDCTSDTAVVVVEFLEPLNVAIMNDTTICQDGDAYVHVVTDSGGDGDYHYTWTFNGTSIGSGYGAEHTPTTEGTYCVTMTDGCETPSAQDCSELFFQVPVPVLIDADTTHGCIPLISKLQVVTPSDLYTQAHWQIGSGLYPLDDEIEFTGMNPGSYDVNLTLISAAGCHFTQTFEDYLVVYPDPSAGWSAVPELTDIENTDVQFTDLSIGSGLEYTWIFDTQNFLGSSHEPNPEFQFPGGIPGEYNVSLLVTDVHGCKNKLEGLVIVHDLLNVYIPNAMTPNQDGVNDEIFVRGTDIDPDHFEWLIYNRWGDVIFSSSNPEQPWVGGDHDGAYYVPDGVYNYILKVQAETTGEAKVIKGWVSVYR